MTLILIGLFIVIELTLIIAGIALMTGTIRISYPTEVCRECRYDLRGLPDETSQCPECGGALLNNRMLVEKTRVDWPKLAMGTFLFLLATCVLPMVAAYVAG